MAVRHKPIGNPGGGLRLLLIDAKGVIRHKPIGNPGEKILDEVIEKMIAEAEKTATK
jgi:hypothetical protein